MLEWPLTGTRVAVCPVAHAASLQLVTHAQPLCAAGGGAALAALYVAHSIYCETLSLIKRIFAVVFFVQLLPLQWLNNRTKMKQRNS